MEEKLDIEEVKIFVDYEIIHECQYPIFCSGSPDLETDCGAPAIYKVYWTREDGTPEGEMLVCDKHFNFILDSERNQAGG